MEVDNMLVAYRQAIVDLRLTQNVDNIRLVEITRWSPGIVGVFSFDAKGSFESVRRTSPGDVRESHG